MNLEQAVETLEHVMVDQWADKPLVEFDNVKFDQPDNESYVHFQVLFGENPNFLNCGGTMTFTQTGTIQLYIYIPANEGSKECWQIADRFRSIFQNTTFDKIRTYEGFVSVPTRESNWYHSRVSIRFEFESK